MKGSISSKPRSESQVDISASAPDLQKAIREFEPKIEWRCIEDLRPNPHNARTHNGKQRRAITASIKKLGFNNPLLIDPRNMIIAGHGRFESAIELGIDKIPVIVLDHLTPDELRAYMLADNQLATLAGWDTEILEIELQHLVEIDFDVDLTGFEAPVINHQIETQLAGSVSDSVNISPEMNAQQRVVSIDGDIWRLGAHRIICGNALLKHMDDAVLHWEANSGEEAVHAQTGRSFVDIARIRTENVSSSPPEGKHLGKEMRHE